MIAQDVKKLKLPDAPGVYFFIGKNGRILYIGKATSLRDRVRSYFTNGLAHARGLHIENMASDAKSVRFQQTDSVLEALILESYLIKKHRPYFNKDEKDDKSFNYVVITKEDFPRLLLVRGRDLEAGRQKGKPLAVKYSFGPFPHGSELREAMKLIRRIFPFRDSCVPLVEGGKGRPCFNRQLGLCPGPCSGEITIADYRRQIQNIKLFLEGKKARVMKNLEREMKAAAKAELFERAGELKRMLFALTHIHDVALLKRESIERHVGETFRIEAYDAAHLGGKQSVAVMTVVESGEVNKNEYRKFRLRLAREADDLSSLEEVLRRRFNHYEWRMPGIVVVDGGKTQKSRAEQVLTELNISVPVIAVVKDEHHRPKDLLGEPALARKHERGILLANSEAHRFAIRYHRELRDRFFVKK